MTKSEFRLSVDHEAASCPFHEVECLAGARMGALANASCILNRSPYGDATDDILEPEPTVWGV